MKYVLCIDDFGANPIIHRYQFYIVSDEDSEYYNIQGSAFYKNRFVEVTQNTGDSKLFRLVTTSVK